MNGLQLLKGAGFLSESDNRLKNDLTPAEIEFIAEVYKSNPGDAVLGRAYLATINRQAVALFMRKNYDEAKRLLHHGLTINPNSPELLYAMGCCLHAAEDLDGARHSWEKAAKLLADFLEPRVNLGNLFFQQDRNEEAAEYFRQALSIRPDDPGVLNSLAATYHLLGRFSEAAECYGRAISLAPTFAEARSNWGKLQLLLGDLETGFKENEWRVKKPDIQKYYYQGILNKPAWQGEWFSGKRLLVHKEQGLGDIIHFARYLPQVKSRGGTVAFSVSRELMQLFSGLAGVDILVEHDSPEFQRLQFDLVVPVMSLPLIFGTTLNTIPSNIPYITAEPARVDQWRPLVTAPEGNKKIGLIWAAKMTDAHSRKRSCGLADVAPLCDVPGITWFSVQKGEGAKQLQGSGLPIIDLTDGLHDFADTAAMISLLDLIITVDTSVAHLAGAMDKPTWLLQTYVPDWRWLLDRDTSPWYPSIRMFRQSGQGDWQGVVARVVQALSQGDRRG